MQKNSIETLILKNEILGYKKNNQIFSNGRGLEQVEKAISLLPENKRVNLPAISLEQVKTGAYEFYGRHFTIHNIATVSLKTVEENLSNLMHSKTGAEVAEKFNSLCIMRNPFEIPINLTAGHSMIGETLKPLIVCPAPDYREKLLIPFSHITLGDNLTPLSTATYIHEIAHVQTESHIGYTEDFYLKEVISIFLEKLAALELDSSGELLRISEKMRFRYLSELLSLYKNPNLAIKFGFINQEQLFNNSCYINSTLLATKLFDNYQKLRKPKDKDIFLRKIQQIFDGEITVEQLLSSENITIAQSKDINLIKRHI